MRAKSRIKKQVRLYKPFFILENGTIINVEFIIRAW